MEDSKIETSEFSEPRGQRTPVDYFFRSLARAHPNAVGIILSGGEPVGAVGVKAIKEDENSIKYAPVGLYPTTIEAPYTQLDTE
jgi:chemotaxis response regulator CheB